ncbi:unnamed protein product, partial [marine sediment metagenome]
MSLVDKWNELSREDIEALRDIKELKKRDIRRLFIFIGKFIKNLNTDLQELKDSAITVRANLIKRMDSLE